MDTRRPVDVLPDRESGTLAAWLREHPGVKVVCRDRAGAYAEGVRDGAPDAIQVADRFHLWKNLCEAAGKTVAAHHHCLRAAAAAQAGQVGPEPVAPVTAAEPAVPSKRSCRLAERTRARYAEVQECLARGLSRAAAARELNLDITTASSAGRNSCTDNTDSGSPLERSRGVRTARCCGRRSRPPQALVATPVKWRAPTRIIAPAALAALGFPARCSTTRSTPRPGHRPDRSPPGWPGGTSAPAARS
jgi:hypothetical protein